MTDLFRLILAVLASLFKLRAHVRLRPGAGGRPWRRKTLPIV
jgi:hypothetical protein